MERKVSANLIKTSARLFVYIDYSLTDKAWEIEELKQF